MNTELRGGFLDDTTLGAFCRLWERCLGKITRSTESGSFVLGSHSHFWEYTSETPHMLVRLSFQ